jgi:hypothetical protein
LSWPLLTTMAFRLITKTKTTQQFSTPNFESNSVTQSSLSWEVQIKAEERRTYKTLFS